MDMGHSKHIKMVAILIGFTFVMSQAIQWKYSYTWRKRQMIFSNDVELLAA